jgi:hypothetical protein
VVDRTLTGSPIYIIDNANYSYILAFIITAASERHGVVSVRVGYTNDLYLPAVQK